MFHVTPRSEKEVGNFGNVRNAGLVSGEAVRREGNAPCWLLATIDNPPPDTREEEEGEGEEHK